MFCPPPGNRRGTVPVALDHYVEPTVGVWLENLILNDLLAWRETEIIKPGLFFRRTVTGEEVEWIWSWSGGSASCQSRSRPRAASAGPTRGRSMPSARSSFAACGLLLYDGHDVLRLAKTTVASPLGSLF